MRWLMPHKQVIHMWITHDKFYILEGTEKILPAWIPFCTTWTLPWAPILKEVDLIQNLWDIFYEFRGMFLFLPAMILTTRGSTISMETCGLKLIISIIPCEKWLAQAPGTPMISHIWWQAAPSVHCNGSRPHLHTGCTWQPQKWLMAGFPALGLWFDRAGDYLRHQNLHSSLGRFFCCAGILRGSCRRRGDRGGGM